MFGSELKCAERKFVCNGYQKAREDGKCEEGKIMGCHISDPSAYFDKFGEVQY